MYSGDTVVHTQWICCSLPFRMALTRSPGFRCRATAKRSLTNASMACPCSGQRPLIRLSAFRPFCCLWTLAKSSPMNRPVTCACASGRAIYASINTLSLTSATPEPQQHLRHRPWSGSAPRKRMQMLLAWCGGALRWVRSVLCLCCLRQRGCISCFLPVFSLTHVFELTGLMSIKPVSLGPSVEPEVLYRQVN